jgi:hypothetical protein
MSNIDDLVDVHEHFTTPHYAEVAKTARHLSPAGMPEARRALPTTPTPFWHKGSEPSRATDTIDQIGAIPCHTRSRA